MSAYSAFPHHTKTTQERYDRGPFPAAEYDLPVLISPYTHVQVHIDEIRSQNNQIFHVSAWHPGIVHCVKIDSYYVSYTDIFDDNVYYVYVKIIDAFRLLRDEPYVLRDTRVAAERAVLITRAADRNVSVLAMPSTPTLPWFVHLSGKVRLQTEFSGGDFVTATVINISTKYITLKLNSMDYRDTRKTTMLRCSEVAKLLPPDDNE